ncbi:MAG: tyrosine-protein phosphatase [Dehalococcoidales bacterium]|nr:tyrosine-protein phosphatase [Dehalococcoidales bacterium]
MQPFYSRSIDFEAVSGFRDLGGYQGKNGRTIAWRRIFRSGELRNMTKVDLFIFKKEIGITSVIDLRNAREGMAQQQEISLLNRIGVKYFYVPLNAYIDRSKEKEQYRDFTHMGQFYLSRIRYPEYGLQITKALEIIAQPALSPIVFHCVAGKDRTGVLAAFVLSVLGVADEDIIDDYSLNAQDMNILFDRLRKDPNIAEDTLNLPAYTWEATPGCFSPTLKGNTARQGDILRRMERRNRCLIDWREIC